MRYQVKEESKILIVDDDPAKVKLLEIILADEGYTIDTVYDGLSAIKKAKAGVYNLILLDIMMPGINGFEVCSKLKQHKSTIDIPIIFITAKDDKDSLVKGFKLGASDYFSQPFEKNEIIVKIHNHVKLNHIENERKIAEKKLLESEKRFKAIMQQSPNVIEIYDLDGLQISVNKAYEELWNFPAKTTLFKFNLLKSKEVVETGLIEFIKKAYAGEAVNVPEYKFNSTGDTEAKGKGRIRWLNTRIYPLIDSNNKVKNIVITHEDITERKIAEGELRHSEERYQKLANATFEGIGISDHGFVIDGNDQLCNMLGYSREEIIGMPVTDLVAPESLELVKKNNKYGHTDSYEHLALRKDGTFFPVEVQGQPFQIEGRILRITVIRDITEQKKTENAIRNESNINKVMSEIATALINPDASIQDVTEIILESAKGLTDSEHGVVSVIDPETGDNVCYTLTKMMEGQCDINEDNKRIRFSRGMDGRYPSLWGHTLNNQKAFFTNSPAEHEVARGVPQGHIPLKNFLATPAMFGDRLVGEIMLANSNRLYTEDDLITINKMTELLAVAINRKEMEDAQVKSEKKFRAIFEQAAVGVAMINSKTGQFIRINHKYCNILGYTGKEMLDLTFQEITHPDDLQANLDNMKKLIEGEISDFTMEKRYFRKVGSVVWINLTVSSMWELSNDALFHIAVIEDITERKEIQRRILNTIIETEEKERSRFAQDLHDGLGPLLSTAKIYVNAIDSSKEPDQKELAIVKSLNVIDEAISSIKEIANNISPHILKNFGLESAIISFLNKINETGQLHISIQSNFEKRIDSNIELSLFRIVTELINNTIKYAQAKKIDISLIKENGSIKLNYSDDGIGFNIRDALEKSSGRGLSNIISRTKALNGQIFFDKFNGKGMMTNINILVYE